MLSFLHLEKVIESNRSGIPSSFLQTMFSSDMLKLHLVLNLLPFVLMSFAGLLIFFDVSSSFFGKSWALYLYSNPLHLEWATNQTLSLLCGALTDTAGRTYGCTSYPSASKSACTSWKTNPPDQLTSPRTFSPTTQRGEISLIALSISGQRCLSSSLPSRFPAEEYGWHG